MHFCDYKDVFEVLVKVYGWSNAFSFSLSLSYVVQLTLVGSFKNHKCGKTLNKNKRKETM